MSAQNPTVGHVSRYLLLPDIKRIKTKVSILVGCWSLLKWEAEWETLWWTSARRFMSINRSRGGSLLANNYLRMSWCLAQLKAKPWHGEVPSGCLSYAHLYVDTSVHIYIYIYDSIYTYMYTCILYNKCTDTSHGLLLLNFWSPAIRRLYPNISKPQFAVGLACKVLPGWYTF